MIPAIDVKILQQKENEYDQKGMTLGEKLKVRDKLREEFKNNCFNYSDIGSKEIGTLTRILKEELSNFDNNGFIMTLCKLRKNDIEYKEDGTLKKCFFMVDGYVEGRIQRFKRREAISFNTQCSKGNGFIGFAGWSDETNIKPFIAAFSRFMNEL